MTSRRWVATRKEVILSLAVAVVLAAALVGIGVIAGSGLSRATPGSHGDLVLDWATTDNTSTSAGTIDSGCHEVLSTAGTVRIDVIAANANDWAGIDFVLDYRSPIVVDRPGPGDGGVDQNFDLAAGFDFVPLDGVDPATFGSNNRLTTGASSSLDYSTTEAVPDGASPHGISLFDNALVGESGDGGLARLTLDISVVPPGFHTLSLGLTGAFAGGIHSDASGFRPDNAPTGTLPVRFASVQMAVDQSCAGAPTPAPTLAPGATPAPTLAPGATPAPAPTLPPGATLAPAPTLAPGATPTPTTTSGPTPTPIAATGDGDGAPVGAIVGGVVGGVVLLAVGGGVGYWYLRMRKM